MTSRNKLHTHFSLSRIVKRSMFWRDQSCMVGSLRLSHRAGREGTDSVFWPFLMAELREELRKRKHWVWVLQKMSKIRGVFFLLCKWMVQFFWLIMVKMLVWNNLACHFQKWSSNMHMLLPQLSLTTLQGSSRSFFLQVRMRTVLREGQVNCYSCLIRKWPGWELNLGRPTWEPLLNLLKTHCHWTE